MSQGANGGRGIDVPWPALAICGAFGAGGLALRMWWVAAVFLGMAALLLAMDQAVRRGWIMHPDERAARTRSRQRQRSTRRAPNSAPPPALKPYSGPIPQLDPAGQAEVRRIVAGLGRAGLFAPTLPDPAFAFPHVADGGADEIALEDVLHALIDPREWLPETDPAGWSANMVLHATQVEQLPEYLVEQVHDLARISHGVLRVEQVEVTEGAQLANRAIPITMRLLLNGEAQEWHWLGHPKYLSTVIHSRMAKALEDGDNTRRLAFFFLDSGFIFACLEPDALDRLADLPSWGHGWVEPDFEHESGSING